MFSQSQEEGIGTQAALETSVVPHEFNITGLQWAPISFNPKFQILGRKISDQYSMGPASYGLRGS